MRLRKFLENRSYPSSFAKATKDRSTSSQLSSVAKAMEGRLPRLRWAGRTNSFRDGRLKVLLGTIPRELTHGAPSNVWGVKDQTPGAGHCPAAFRTPAHQDNRGFSLQTSARKQQSFAHREQRYGLL